jgi:hypothetical protein
MNPVLVSYRAMYEEGYNVLKKDHIVTYNKRFH